MSAPFAFPVAIHVPFATPSSVLLSKPAAVLFRVEPYVEVRVGLLEPVNIKVVYEYVWQYGPEQFFCVLMRR